jgi:hypothetical protein
LDPSLPLSADTLHDASAANLTVINARPARRALPHALLTVGVVLVAAAGALGAWRYYAVQPAAPNVSATADSTHSATDTMRTTTGTDSARAAVSSAQDTTAQSAARHDSARVSPRGSR